MTPKHQAQREQVRALLAQGRTDEEIVAALQGRATWQLRGATIALTHPVSPTRLTIERHIVAVRSENARAARRTARKR